MSFQAGADAYDRFMGRYSSQLARLFADYARPHGDVLDVGCGPGALTAELVRRLGAAHVAAADPTEPFVEAARARFPGVDVRLAPAESLPFDDDAFDVALAQLVVSFMSDPLAAVRELARVTRTGGVIAVCVWDLAGEAPLTPFWRAASAVDPAAPDESTHLGAREGQLVDLLEAAGLREVEGGALTFTHEHESFEEWWGPFTLGVGPAGAYLATLDAAARDAVRERSRADLGDGPLSLTCRAWAARGVV